MIYSYEINDWDDSIKYVQSEDSNFSILDDEEPIIDSNFDEIYEGEILCLTKANLLMI